MNRTRLLTIAVVGLLLLNFGTLGVMLLHKPGNRGLPGMPPPPGEGPKKIIIERLHFTPEQSARYEVLISEHRKRTDELHEASKRLHRELYSMLAGDADKTLKDSVIEQIAANQRAIENLNFDHFGQIKELCTPEQKVFFSDLAKDLSGLFTPQGPQGPPPPMPMP